MTVFNLVAAACLTCALGTETEDRLPEEFLVEAEVPYMELKRTTVYDGPSDTTSTGRKAEYGIVAYDPAYYGKCCILYTEDMEYIGIFECQDTGGKKVRSGERIDVYCPTRQACYDWVAENGEYCYVQWIDAEG